MRLKQSLIVIAGLDPAIYAHGSACAHALVDGGCAGGVALDRRVKPGDDTEMV